MTLWASGAVLNSFGAGESLLWLYCFLVWTGALDFSPRWQCCTRICHFHVYISTTIICKLTHFFLSSSVTFLVTHHMHRFKYLKPSVITCTHSHDKVVLFVIACQDMWQFSLTISSAWSWWTSLVPVHSLPPYWHVCSLCHRPMQTTVQQYCLYSHLH